MGNKAKDANIIAGIIVAVLVAAIVAALVVPIWYRRRKDWEVAKESGHLLSLPMTTHGRSSSACSNSSNDYIPQLQQQQSLNSQSPGLLSLPDSRPRYSSMLVSDSPQLRTATEFPLPSYLHATFVEPTLDHEQTSHLATYNYHAPPTSLPTPTAQAALSGLPGFPSTRPTSASSTYFDHHSNQHTSIIEESGIQPSIASPTTQAKLTAMPSYALDAPPCIDDVQVMSPLNITPLTAGSRPGQYTHMRTFTQGTIVSPLISPLAAPTPQQRTVSPARPSYVEMESPLLPRSRQATFIMDGDTLRQLDFTPPPEKAFRYG